MNARERLTSDTPAATDTKQGISRTLAQFTSSLTLDAVPEDICERAKHLILDSIGLAFATRNQPYARQTLAALQAFGAGDAAVIGHAERLPLRDAMLLNGLLIHGLDFDDTHARGVIHSTASALPCVLGLAERENVDGATFLSAYLAAMEVSTRLGTVAAGGFHRKGFHPTGLVGAFGCTLAAARLIGANVEQATHAQGIALSMASGSLEFLEDGAWTKRLHPGWAAVCGTTAAMLAKYDFIGPGAPYDGRYGLYALHLATPETNTTAHADGSDPLAAFGIDISLATAGLGEVWEITDVSLKPIPACHFTHAPSDAAIALQRQHSLRAEDIERVVVKMPAATVNVVCEPQGIKKRPKNAYDAQFSIPYIVAVGLLRGRFTLDDLDAEALTAPDVIALAQKVFWEVDTETDFPRHYTGEVIVEMRDGTRHAHREAINRGSADRPLTNDDIVEKFIANARRTLDATSVERVRKAVLALDRQPARALVDALRMQR